jgi:hypothetical protein
MSARRAGRQTGGRRASVCRRCSILRSTEVNKASCPGLTTTWSPTGSPSRVHPQGSEAAG